MRKPVIIILHQIKRLKVLASRPLPDLSCVLPTNCWRSVLAAGLAVLVACASVSSLAQAKAPELTVKPSFPAKQAISPLEQIVLSLSRPLEPSEGRLAVFVALTDMTALFMATPKRLSYAPKSLPLPVGENPLTIYLVSPDDEWRQLARFTLRVAKDQAVETTQNASQQNTAGNATQKGPNGNGKRFGFNKFAVIPSLTLSLDSQPAESHFPGSNQPDRPTYTDFSLQGTITTDMANGPFNSQTQFDFVGNSFQQQALRYGELGDRAPQIDLSSYLMQFQLGKAKVSLGHVSFGTNRFLIDSFSSRGITVAYPVNKRFSSTAQRLAERQSRGWESTLARYGTRSKRKLN